MGALGCKHIHIVLIANVSYELIIDFPKDNMMC